MVSGTSREGIDVPFSQPDPSPVLSRGPQVETLSPVLNGVQVKVSDSSSDGGQLSDVQAISFPSVEELGLKPDGPAQPSNRPHPDPSGKNSSVTAGTNLKSNPEANGTLIDPALGKPQEEGRVPEINPVRGPEVVSPAGGLENGKSKTDSGSGENFNAETAGPGALPDGIRPEGESGNPAGFPPDNLRVERGGELSSKLVKTAALPPDPGSTGLLQQVTKGLAWSLSRGEEKIQMALDPPQLGNIFFELHRHHDTVEARIWTDNPAVKGLLENQQAQIQRAMEQNGFKLDRFEVAVHPDLKSFQEDRWNGEQQPPGSGSRDPEKAQTAGPPSWNSRSSRAAVSKRATCTSIPGYNPNREVKDMTLTPLTKESPSGGTSGQPAGATGKNTLDQVDFMKIFAAQLKFQDPTNPLDNYEMASQMAQFGMVESLNKMAETIENLAITQAAMNNLQTASMVGKKVEVKGNELTVSEGKASEGYYQLEKAGKVTVKIYDSNGTLVRTMEVEAKDASKHKLTWDGQDQAGNKAADGQYTFKVSAVDDKGQSIKVTTTMTGKVESVSYDNGGPALKIGSKTYHLSDIIAILA